MEQLDNIVTLIDEDGNDVKFEFLDLVEYEDEEYVILLPVCEDEDYLEDNSEVVILKLISNDDETGEYVTVEDEQILYSVFNMFKAKIEE